MTLVVTTPQRDPGRWMVLFACIIAVLMVAIDSGILTLIVPSIQNDLNASQSTIGLLSSILTLMLAAFILGGGTLGDLYGRRFIRSCTCSHFSLDGFSCQFWLPESGYRFTETDPSWRSVKHRAVNQFCF